MKAAFQEQLKLVCELQEIDLNLHNLNLALSGLPLRIKETESAYFAVKADLDAARAELEEVEKAKRTDEMELAASVDHLRTREAKLYAIKTNKEYQAALKEVSEGKRINREREDRILQCMEKIDVLAKKIEQLEQVFADKEGAYSTGRQEVEKEVAEIRSNMTVDEARRPEVAAKIEKDVIRKYEFVRQRYAQAIAVVIDGICQGCSTRIPPQLFNEILRKDKLKACPSCQRLIYVEDAPAAENAENKEGG